MATGRSNTPNTMTIISADMDDEQEETERWATRIYGARRPDSSNLGKRTPTPTKQIALQAVRRKEQGESNFNSFDFDETPYSPKQGSRNKSLESNKEQSSSKNKSHRTTIKETTTIVNGVSHVTIGNQDESESSSNEEQEEEDEEKKEKPTKAPNELLMEFITCVMQRDFPNAQKLCTMILLYEPNNKEALTFKPLIEEKMLLEAELALEQSDSEEGSDDEEDDGDDDEDSDESSSSEDDDDDGDENEDVNNDGDKNNENDEDEDEEELSVYQYMLKNL